MSQTYGRTRGRSDILNPLTLDLEEFCRSENGSKCLGDLVKALFSRAITDHQKLSEIQLSAALGYLQIRLAGILLDKFCAYERPEELRLEDNIVGLHLWQRLQRLFPDVHEQRVAFWLFHRNLSPSDMLRYAPQEFNDTQEICHVRRQMLDRILLESDHMR